jgi:large subunit ribosomal protein L5
VDEMNPMKEIRIEKVTLNVGCGDDAAKIEKGKKLLEYLTNQKPMITTSKKRSTFGVPKHKPIGAKVTLRGEQAVEFFKSVLETTEKKIKLSQFDKDGNINFGIKDYIDLPSIKYQYAIGMFGFDVAVTLERAGYHIKKRKIQQKKLSKKHKINKEEAVNWLREKFGVKVE